MRVDRVDDGVDAVEDVTLDRDAAIGHDLLHFFPAHVEVFVEVVHDLLYDDAEFKGGYMAFFIGKGSSFIDFSTSPKVFT